MNLTEKCKEDFEKWFSDNTNRVLNLTNADSFYKYPESMQWGVFQEFFDSVEDESEIRILGKVSRGIDRYFLELRGNMYAHNTRQEARTAAIEKANEIYNSK